MGSEWEEVELRILKVLLQLRNESIIFERLMYKNVNQHRRALYFRRLCQVRRDLRLLQSAQLSELVHHAAQCLNLPLRETAITSSRKTSSNVMSSSDLRRRLHGVARLMEQMAEPIFNASLQIAGLLGQTFFMPFALTTFAILARLRVLVSQALHDIVNIFNLASFCIRTKERLNANLPASLDCNWDGTKLSLVGTYMDQQQVDAQAQDVGLVEDCNRQNTGAHEAGFVEDSHGRKYTVLGSLVSEKWPEFERDIAAEVERECCNEPTVGIPEASEADAAGPLLTALAVDTCDTTSGRQPDVSIQHAEDRKEILEDHFGSALMPPKKKVAYVSVVSDAASKLEKTEEEGPPLKIQKDALFDMLVGIGDKLGDTLF